MFVEMSTSVFLISVNDKLVNKEFSFDTERIYCAIEGDFKSDKMSRLCRLCAEPRNSDQIKTTINDIGWNVETKLIYCCQWNTLQMDDGLPQEVCNVCFEKLEECWKFSQNVSIAQAKLQELYGSKSIISTDDFFEHNASKEFYCSKCAESFRSRYKLKKHLALRHNDENHKKNSKVNIKLSDNHKKILKEVKREEPSDNFDAVNVEIKCEDDRDDQNADIHDQYKNDFPNAAKFECDQCDKEFDTEIECRNHIKNTNHAAAGPYFCYLCEKQFTKLAQLRFHMHSHTKPKLFSCKYCHKPFRFGRSYYNHLKAKHELDKAIAKQIMKELGDIALTGRFVCELCGKVFTENNRLRYHKVTHFDERPHKCEHCGKGFKLKSHLNTHYRVHTGERKHQCTECGKRFTQKVILEKHMEDHSGNISRPFPCDYCEKHFRTQFNLTNHRRTHTGEKPYRCDVCNHGFATKSQLDRHDKTQSHLNKCNELINHPI